MIFVTDTKLYCRDCIDELTVICRDCGRRIWNEDNVGDEYPLCRECFDSNYTTCSDCGRVIHLDDAYYDDDEPLCYDCYSYSDTRFLHDYSYKPEPIFYGKGN